MIISASRRTDIPALYADWFFNRLSEKYILVRHPMQPHRVSRVSLLPDDVDGIVFWTKNPLPLLDRLPLLAAYPFYVQFTLTPYGADVEENLPAKARLVDTFRRLSDVLGPSRVVWRYDPILISRTYTKNAHLEAFSGMARQLAGYTEQCTFSFLDYYRKIAKAVSDLGLVSVSEADKIELASGMAEIAKAHGFLLNTCAEGLELSACGIGRARCIDGRIFAKITGRPYKMEKDKGQRPGCLCVPSVDIGAYHTCTNGCRYCYASSPGQTTARARQYDPASPLLCGSLSEQDIVAERKPVSALEAQTGLELLHE